MTREITKDHIEAAKRSLKLATKTDAELGEILALHEKLDAFASQAIVKALREVQAERNKGEAK
jgi:hypothetical protein